MCALSTLQHNPLIRPVSSSLIEALLAYMVSEPRSQTMTSMIVVNCLQFIQIMMINQMLTCPPKMMVGMNTWTLVKNVQLYAAIYAGPEMIENDSGSLTDGDRGMKDSKYLI